MNRVKLFAVIAVTLVLLSACGNKNTVMTVGGKDISYDTYRYFYMNYSKESEDYTENLIYEKAVDAIASDVALNKLAERYDIKLSKYDRKAVDEYVDTSIANYGSRQAYLEALEKNYLTEELFRYFYSQQLLETKLREYMYDEVNNIIKSDDATFEKDLQENFMAAKQILIRNDKDDDIEENKALADSLYARAINGEDFDTLIAEYSEDTSARDDYVYHFTHGQLLEAFEEAVEQTEEGKICSRVAVSEAGYHIVMRMPLDTEYINDNFEDLRDAYKARRFNEIREEMADSFAIDISDNFDTLKFE